MTRKGQFANVRRILVKVGSAVLTGEEGLDLNIIEQLVGDIAALRSGDTKSSWSAPAPSPPESTAWESNANSRASLRSRRPPPSARDG